MQDTLFIPGKLKVGFQTRGDTFTKKLAYIIYFDATGKLRKETSWEGWRDKKINPLEIDNAPHSGLVLNKSVKRDSGYFGNGRNMIRIWDDRGFEFEITTGNLLFILMTTNCHKRGLEGEFVYAWYGKELILLPTDCDEYRNSIKFTELQGQKISSKSLIQGATYETKQQEKLTYLGKYLWYDRGYGYGSGQPIRKSRKKFIFVDENGGLVDLLAISKLARCVSDVPVENYAELMDGFTSSIESSKIVALSPGGKRKIKVKPYGGNYYKYDPYQNLSYIELDADGKYNLFKFEIENNYADYDKKPVVFNLNRSPYRFSLVNGELVCEFEKVTYTRSGYYGGTDVRIKDTALVRRGMSLEEVEALEIPETLITLENGKSYLIEEKINLANHYGY